MATVREILTRWVFKSDTKAVEQLDAKLAQAKDTAATLFQGLAVLTGAATGAGVGIFKLTTRIAEQSHEILKLTSKTGFGTDMLQQLRHAASKTHVPFELLTGGLRKFAQFTEAATHGNKNAAKQLKAYGIEVKDGHGKLKTQDELLAETLFRMEAMGDGSKRMAMAMKLFGRSGTDMLPMLDEGALGLSEMMRAAKESGKVIGGPALKAGKAMSNQLDELNKTSSSFKATIGKELLPVVSDVIYRINNWVKANKGLINQKVHEIAKQAAEAIRALVKQSERGDIFGKLTSLVKGFASAITWLLSHKTALEWFFKILAGGVIVAKVGPAIQLVTGAVGLLAKASVNHPVLALLAGMIALGAYVVTNWKEIRSELNSAGKESAHLAVNMAQPWAETILMIRGWFEDLFADIKSGIADLVSGRAFTGQGLVQGAIERARRAQNRALTAQELVNQGFGAMRRGVQSAGAAPAALAPAALPLMPAGGAAAMGMQMLAPSIVNNITLPPGTASKDGRKVGDAAGDAVKKTLRNTAAGLRR